MKYSSRFDVKIPRNLTRSSNGVRSSSASCSTRRLNSSHDTSRLRNSSGDTSPACGGGEPGTDEPGITGPMADAGLGGNGAVAEVPSMSSLDDSSSECGAPQPGYRQDRTITEPTPKWITANVPGEVRAGRIGAAC